MKENQTKWQWLEFTIGIIVVSVFYGIVCSISPNICFSSTERLEKELAERYQEQLKEAEYQRILNAIRNSLDE